MLPPPQQPKPVVPRPVVPIVFKKPIVVTKALTNITNTGVKTGGTITTPSPGLAVTARGVCWNTSPAPTIANFIMPDAIGGPGSFNRGVSGLKSGQKYYLRAYATTAAGTTYGNELTFTTTVKDRDGNAYETVTIGTQVWMKQNLHTKKNKVGVAIPLITGDVPWRTATTAAYTMYDNNPANAATYGFLYNWAATANLAPAGWRIPTKADWETLISNLATEQGNRLKATSLWKLPRTGVAINTNTSGFSALPAGYRLYDVGTFGYLLEQSIFWSSTEAPDGLAYACYLGYEDPLAAVGQNVQQSGFSVRCIRE
jgi:uncharacterized protein (TIGR02145 family)